jgi:hypothetical protein
MMLRLSAKSMIFSRRGLGRIWPVGFWGLLVVLSGYARNSEANKGVPT